MHLRAYPCHSYIERSLASQPYFPRVSMRVWKVGGGKGTLDSFSFSCVLRAPRKFPIAACAHDRSVLSFYALEVYCVLPLFAEDCISRHCSFVRRASGLIYTSWYFPAHVSVAALSSSVQSPTYTARIFLSFIARTWSFIREMRGLTTTTIDLPSVPSLHEGFHNSLLLQAETAITVLLYTIDRLSICMYVTILYRMCMFVICIASLYVILMCV